MGTVRLFGCLGAAAGLMACGGQTLTSATPDGGGGVDASVDASADVAPDTRPATLDAPIDTALPDTATADAPPDVLVSLDGGVNLAVHEVFLGDTDRNGTASQNAWQQYGMNLDGKVTTLSSTDVCMLAAGAPQPAAIIGVPVGFVGAAESKAALVADPRGVPFLVVRGRMGGSAMAAAAVNALARAGL